MKCLTNIIGVTQNTCACITQGCTSEDIEKMQTSVSGLFLDEVEGGIDFKSLKNSGDCKTLCEKMLSARSIAEKQTANDVLLALTSQYEEDKRKYVGDIGERYVTGAKGVSKRYVGMKISPRSTDGVVRITAMDLIVDRVGITQVQIIRAYKGAETGTVIHTFDNVNTAANVFSPVTLGGAIELPLMYNNSEVEYWIVYDRLAGGGLIPRNNKMLCNCGEQTRLLGQYVYLEGVETDNINSLNHHFGDSSYAYGVVLKVEIRCDQSAFVCREFDSKNAISITLANAVMYKAAELLIEDILKSPEVNRYTMQNREFLWGKRNHFRKEYQNRITYIATTADITSTDCYICKRGPMDLQIAGIII
jgi:hypothetical protein